MFAKIYQDIRRLAKVRFVIARLQLRPQHKCRFKIHELVHLMCTAVHEPHVVLLIDKVTVWDVEGALSPLARQAPVDLRDEAQHGASDRRRDSERVVGGESGLVPHSPATVKRHEVVRIRSHTHHLSTLTEAI